MSFFVFGPLTIIKDILKRKNKAIRRVFETENWESRKEHEF